MDNPRRRGFFTTARLMALTFTVPAIFLASMPWLRHQPDMVIYAATALTAFWALAGGGIAAISADRDSDEWERSGSRFSHLWGGLTGSGIVALMLALPPIHDLLVLMAARIQGTASSEIDRTMVILVFTAGYLAVVLTQVACTLLFMLVWRRRTLGAR